MANSNQPKGQFKVQYKSSGTIVLTVANGSLGYWIASRLL